MLTLSFFIFCGLFAAMLFGCARLCGGNSTMRLLNADWLEQGEKFRLVARWGERL